MLPKTGYFDHGFPIPVIEVIKIHSENLMQNEVTADEALATIEAEHATNRG